MRPTLSIGGQSPGSIRLGRADTGRVMCRGPWNACPASACCTQRSHPCVARHYAPVRAGPTSRKPCKRDQVGHRARGRRSDGRDGRVNARCRWARRSDARGRPTTLTPCVRWSARVRHRTCGQEERQTKNEKPSRSQSVRPAKGALKQVLVEKSCGTLYC